MAVGVGVGRQRGKKYPTDLDKQIEVLIVCSVYGVVFCFVCVEKLNQLMYVYILCVQNNNDKEKSEKLLLCLLFSGAVSLLLMLLQANFACPYINKKLHLIVICTKFAKIYSDFDKLSSFSSVWPSGLRVCLTSTTIPIKFSLTKQNPYHNAASGLGYVYCNKYNRS